MQALDRLITILELVAEQDQPAGPAEIATEMDLPLSTVARLMRQLAEAGLLYRSPEDGRYSLGSRVFALASSGISHLGLAEAALPVMRELRDGSGETISLHVLRGILRVCVAEVQSHFSVRRVVPPGMAQQTLGTATGEILLADCSPTDLEAIVADAGLGAKRRRELEKRLEQIRAEGYAIRDDFAEDLTGLSAPVAGGGRTVAALTISGPSSRFDRKAAERFAPQLVAAAAGLSRLR